jgi:hypothetical protein
MLAILDSTTESLEKAHYGDGLRADPSQPSGLTARPQT